MKVTKELAEAATKIAARGAAEYLRAHSRQADSTALAEALQRQITAKMQGALDDAAEALACHMESIAEHTFAASMMQAGSEAAKDVAQGKPPPKSKRAWQCLRGLANGID